MHNAKGFDLRKTMPSKKSLDQRKKKLRKEKKKKIEKHRGFTVSRKILNEYQTKKLRNNR